MTFIPRMHRLLLTGAAGGLGQVLRTIWPFCGALIFALALVTVVPAFSTWLPGLLMKVH
ncbi:hypothetical protein H9K76_13305 [Diaphorobacter ruginosibacter]|uniref:Uncharacterized protein n=1 Tax=Diaphorobacter ruginosibacter TaxID=1715720 RepID=A0A7G9RW32_9BURK|nr:hypothetical protein [Diaphorobacter ruginosibacter]QNN59807.1 hypothetical protein H9K76_13305 [Diaphorobacter ruginosibacter]